MFTQINTSKENKEIVSLLTRKLNLGTENIVARIAYTYSLSQDKKLDLNKIKMLAVKTTLNPSFLEIITICILV
jgi:hypothetical protein